MLPLRLPEFQSTRPAWGATQVHLEYSTSGSNFNPRAPHGARHIPGAAPLPAGKISIHAPRMGRDQLHAQTDNACHDFNPRAPHGARLTPTHSTETLYLFQSTRPAWGATASLRSFLASVMISIHAPRMGRDALTGRCSVAGK